MFCNSMLFYIICSANAHSKLMHCLISINNYFWNSNAQETMKEGDGMSGHICPKRITIILQGCWGSRLDWADSYCWPFAESSAVTSQVYHVSRKWSYILGSGSILIRGRSRQRSIVWLIFEERPRALFCYQCVQRQKDGWILYSSETHAVALY